MKRVSVAALAEQAIVNGGKRLVSVPAMVAELRSAVPGCEHTDEELAHLVSMIAISKGCDLAFVPRPSIEEGGRRGREAA